MHTLESLQKLGVLLMSVKSVAYDGAVTISTMLSWDTSQSGRFSGAVIVDNPVWVGTANGMPIEEATNVYSSDGTVVGRWNKAKRSFYKMFLQTGTEQGISTLATEQIYSFKEEKEMDGINIEELEKSLAAEGYETSKAVAFDNTPDPFKAKEGMSEHDKKNEEERKHFDSIRKKLESGFNGAASAPYDVVRHNRQNGVLVGFITGTDSVVKVNVGSAPRIGNDGRKVLDPNVSADVKAAFEKGEKVANKNFIQEKVFTFRDAKPTSAKAIVVKTPAGTDLPLTDIGKGDSVRYDLDDRTMKTHVLDMNTGWVYLAFLYGDRIKEDSSLMGESAELLEVQHSFSRTKDGTDKPRNIIKPKNRTALLVPGNFFPLKTYQTISTQDLSPENKKVLNLNFEALFARAKNDLNAALSADSRKKISVDEATGEYKTAWIDDGEAISVPTYYDKDSVIRNVRLPRREKAMKKDGSGYLYKFVYDSITSENGPLTNPEYADFIKATGFTSEAFGKLLQQVTQKKRSGTSKRVNKSITQEQYLRGILAKDPLVVTESIDLTALQDQLDQLEME